MQIGRKKVLLKKNQIWRSLIVILLVTMINFSFVAPALATRYWKVINEHDSLVNVAINGIILKPGQDSGSIYYPNTRTFELMGIGKIEFQPGTSDSNDGRFYDLEFLMATNKNGKPTGYMPALAEINFWDNSALDVHIGKNSIWLSDYHDSNNPYLQAGQPMRESQFCHLFN